MIKLGGAGHHTNTLPPTKIRILLQLIKAQELAYVMSLPFPKLAVLCFYHRVLRYRLLGYCLYVTGFVIVTTCLLGVIGGFFNCRPFHSFWEPGIRAHCTMDAMVAFRYYSIPNITTDIAMILIPIPAMLKLKVGILTWIGIILTLSTCTL